MYLDNGLISEDKIILDKVNGYFERLNKEDSYNYFNNLEEITFEKSTMGYYLFPSKIYYNNLWVLVHELFHLSSYDKEKQIDGFCDNESNGIALTEGMTEYLTMELFNEDRPTAFFLEVFTIAMLLCVSNFKSFYFRTSREEFINSFINDKNIRELSSLLDRYYYINHGKDMVPIEEVSLLVDKILDLLLEIIFENEKDVIKLREYMDKFISLLERYSKSYTLFDRKVINNYSRVLERK